MSSDKPERCPNRECGSKVVDLFFDDYQESWAELCSRCGMRGPAYEVDDSSDDAEMEAAKARALYLWNNLPRDASPAGLARGEL